VSLKKFNPRATSIDYAKMLRNPGKGDMHTAAMPATNLSRNRRCLPILLFGNALMRIAGGASGVLVGLFLAELAKQGAPVNTALVASLGAVSFAAEVVGALPMGLLSDALSPRVLMTGGAVAGAAATQLFGMSTLTGIFFLSRASEGLGAAAGVPPLLAHLTDATDRDPALRARVMSYFELFYWPGWHSAGCSEASCGAQPSTFYAARYFI
jgi:MFS family permease